MTAANGTPVLPPRRPSAASRCAGARGAPLPRAATLALGLAAVLAVPACAGGPAAVPAPTEAAADAPQRPVPLAAASGSPRAACLNGARRAEAAHGLPEGLLVALSLSESGLHPHALNIRGRAHFPDDPVTARAMLARAPGTVFAGCMQIHARAHARGSDWPLDADRATDWAGALLARGYAETGSWSGAIARFHGGSTAGTRRVICRVRAKLEVASPGSPLLRDLGCGRPADVRVVRSGATMLEIAEAR